MNGAATVHAKSDPLFESLLFLLLSLQKCQVQCLNTDCFDCIKSISINILPKLYRLFSGQYIRAAQSVTDQRDQNINYNVQHKVIEAF